MQLRRLRLGLCAALLALGGCTCNQDLCVMTNVTPVTLFFATAWQPVTVTPLLPVTCGSRTATSVTVSVLDEASNTIAHTKSDPRTGGDGFDVDITFTPTQPGTYHVVARFEPNFGTAQADVLVAAERRDGGSVLVTHPCERGDFTPGGLVLCTSFGFVHVLDAGQRFRGGARWGSTLWSSDGNRVERWVEDGGAFELTGVATISSANVVTIVPGDEDALLRGGSGQLWRWFDGGIRVVDGLTLEASELLWRSGTNVAFIKRINRAWCAGNIPGDAGERCTILTGPTGVALGPEGIWLQNETMLGSEVMLVDHRMSTGFALPAGWAVFAPGPLSWDNGAVLDAGARDAGPFVLGRSGDSILLENYGPNVRGITSTCVTVPEGSSTRLYRR